MSLLSSTTPVLPAAALLSALLVATPAAQAATIFESGTLGTTGITGEDVFNQVVLGANVNANVFNGVRFELNQPALTSDIGGHFVARPGVGGSFFGAVVELADENDFPDSGDLSTPDVLGHATLNFPEPSSEANGTLELFLDPGWYALVFGSGLFSSGGSGAAVLNNSDINAPDYFAFNENIGWFELDGFLSDFRLTLGGVVVPEPPTITFVLLLLLVMNRRWTRFQSRLLPSVNQRDVVNRLRKATRGISLWDTQLWPARCLTPKLSFEACEQRHLLTSFSVNVDYDVIGSNIGDFNLGDSVVSLREAIVRAETLAGPDEIVFDSSLNGATITLGLDEFGQSLGFSGNQGELDITESITIDALANTPLGVTIIAHDPDGIGNGNGSRIFDVSTFAFSGTSLFAFRGLTLTGGDPSGTLPAGGAIRANIEAVGSGSVELVVEHTTLQNNRADRGGAVSVSLNPTSSGSASAAFRDVEIFDNEAQTSGGGLRFFMGNNASVTVSDSIISGNDALAQDGSIDYDAGGGGIDVRVNQNVQGASIEISDSRITGNTADKGGGAKVSMAYPGHEQLPDTVFELQGSILQDNTAFDRGGGLYIVGAAGSTSTIQDSTITGNKAGLELENGTSFDRLFDSGGGVYAYLFSGDDPVGEENSDRTDNEIAVLTITGTTIDNNQAGRNGGGVAICTKRQDFTREVQSEVSFVNSTISANQAGFADDPNTTTVGDAVVGRGGGVHIAVFSDADGYDEVEGVDTTFVNATVTENTATIGGGVYSVRPFYGDDPSPAGNDDDDDDTQVNTILQNTIMAGNVDFDGAANNFYGSINADASEYNLFGPDANLPNRFFNYLAPASTPATTFHEALVYATALASDNFVVLSNNPLLEDLAHHGGPTPVRRPMTSSPVIDRGLNTLAVDLPSKNPLSTDQRGFDRFVDYPGVTPDGIDTVDIGAVELQPPGPRVDKVVISGTTSTHAAYDFTTVDGSGAQLSTVPVGGANRIDITFSEDVNVLQSDLQLVSLLRGSNSAVVDHDYDPPTRTAYWEFQSPFSSSATVTGDFFAIRLKESITAVSDGDALDGEWVNPRSVSSAHADISTFPSGNGERGGEFQFVFTTMLGDTTLDNFMNPDFTDQDAWEEYYGIESGATYQQGDLDGDGDVDNADLLAFQLAYSAPDLTGDLFIRTDLDGDLDVDADDQQLLIDEIFGGGSGGFTLSDLTIWQRQFGLDIDVA